MLVAFNKPYRVLSQFTDDQGRLTLADFIKIKEVYSIGRLDYDSEGLMLLTDDGKLQHKLANPKHKVDKVYLVQVEGVAKKPALDELRNGIKLKDGKSKAVNVKMLFKKPTYVWKREPPIRQRKNSPTSWVEITINEGRNRQVRRMMAHVGLPVLRLIRLSIGDYRLDNLALGDHKILHVKKV
ncbi:MAG: pseudouridine synthase [Marinicellaceae bacterium]